MSSSFDFPIRRVLAVFSVGEADKALLEASAQLAARLGVELRGLIVGQHELLQLAQLPFAREIGLMSGMARALTYPELERRLRAQAAGLEQALMTRAAQLKVRGSLSVVRGVTGSTLAEFIEETDLVFIVRGEISSRVVRDIGVGAAREQEVRRASVVMLPTVTALRPPFAVLYDGSLVARQALQLAARLSLTDDRSLVVVLPSADSVQCGRWAAEIEAALNGMPLHLHVESLGLRGVAALAAWLRRRAVGTLVLPHENAMLGDEVHTLARQTRSALVVVRGGFGNA